MVLIFPTSVYPFISCATWTGSIYGATNNNSLIVTWKSCWIVPFSFQCGTGVSRHESLRTTWASRAVILGHNREQCSILLSFYEPQACSETGTSQNAKLCTQLCTGRIAHSIESQVEPEVSNYLCIVLSGLMAKIFISLLAPRKLIN